MQRRMPGAEELLPGASGWNRTDGDRHAPRQTKANAQGIIAEMNAISKAKAIKEDSPGNGVVDQGGERRTGQQGRSGKDTFWDQNVQGS